MKKELCFQSMLLLVVFSISSTLLHSQWKSIPAKDDPVTSLCSLEDNMPIFEHDEAFINLKSSINAEHTFVYSNNDLAFIECDSRLLTISKKQFELTGTMQTNLPKDHTPRNGVIYHSKWFICTSYGILTSSDKGITWKFVNDGFPIVSWRAPGEPNELVTTAHTFIDGIIHTSWIRVIHDTLLAATSDGLYFLHENSWLKYNPNLPSGDFPIMLLTDNIIVFERDLRPANRNDPQYNELFIVFQGKHIKSMLPKPKQNTFDVRYFNCGDRLFCSYPDGSLFVFLNEKNTWQDCGQGLLSSTWDGLRNFTQTEARTDPMDTLRKPKGSRVRINESEPEPEPSTVATVNILDNECCKQEPGIVVSLLLRNNELILTTADNREFYRSFNEIP